MRLKQVLLVGLIAVILPINVFAETFTDGDKTYDLKERVIPCVENLDYETTLKDGTMIYINPDATKEIETFVKLGHDNQCYSITKTEDILNLVHKLDYNLYEIWFEYVSVGEEGIYRTVDRNSYIRDGYKKAIEYTAGEEYYTYDNINSHYKSVGEIDEVSFNSGEYYEMANFKLPDSAEIKDGIDYYTTTDGITFTKENNPTSDKILSYAVITDKEVLETTKIKDISDELVEALSKIDYKRVDIVTSANEKEFYVIAYMNDDFDEWSIYDESGNLLFEKVSWFTTILDELYAVTKDNKTYIYNKNMEVIYVASEDLQLEELGFSNNISSLGGIDRKLYQLVKTTKKEEVTSSITNPETSDGIIGTMIMAIVTGLGVVSLILLQRRQKNN